MRFSLATSSIVSTLVSVVLAAPANLKAPAPFEFIAAEETSSLAKRNIGGVRLCTGSAWTGWCQYVIWPLNECISLNDLGRCDANNEYADVRYESLGLGHLEVLSFVANMSSYQCFEPIDS
ncbi:hypothetical protein D0859_14136 [Hortaea werneckii]|uniref:Uncharacterized protein n=1 Tax=Hortaea werneckii TaxID=91943 RepID=A0A3M7I8L6_HORWE|nr:hypothetical protein D0859_14136 [Hortaea werneckii]